MNKWTWLIVVVVLIGGTVLLARMPNRPGKLDQFAMCLKDSGITFYGAFWCPHCQAQKAMFGSSAKLLPYVECSLPDGQHQTQICIDKGVSTYPTWELKDGTRLPVETNAGVSLATLSEKTNCPLPQNE